MTICQEPVGTTINKANTRINCWPCQNGTVVLVPATTCARIRLPAVRNDKPIDAIVALPDVEWLVTLALTARR